MREKEELGFVQLATPSTLTALFHSHHEGLPTVENKFEVQNSSLHAGFLGNHPSQLAGHKQPAGSRLLLCECTEISTLVP